MNVLSKTLGLLACAALVAVAAAQSLQRPTAEQPDRARVAQTLVSQCAGIGHNELVLITGGTRDLKLLEEIAVEVRRQGAHPLVTIKTEPMARRLFTDVPAELDTQKPTFALRLAEMIDAHIYVDFREHPDFLADIPPQRLTNEARGVMAVEEAMLKRGVRQVYLGNGLYPTRGLAAQFRIPQSDLSRIFWNAVNVNYTQLQATGEKVQKRLTDAKELRITAPNGTNLNINIAERPVFVSDGVISTKDRYAGSPACQAWLPAGEVYVTPVPGTANGTFIADHYFFEGTYIERLKLEFTNGRLTGMSAKGDITPLKRRYDAAPAGRDVFGVVDVGINKNIEIPAGSRMVTWMGAGTISIIVGDNTWAGGENSVPFWLSAHLVNGTLTVDGKPLIENARLRIGRID